MPHRTPRTQAVKHGFVPVSVPAQNPALNAPVSIVGNARPHYPAGREASELRDVEAAFNREAPHAPGTATGSRRR